MTDWNSYYMNKPTDLSTLYPMTDWNSYYMNKPTDLSTLYPMTAEVLEALEDRELERVMRRVVRALTTLVALIGIWLAYATYPEWSWFFVLP